MEIDSKSEQINTAGIISRSELFTSVIALAASIVVVVFFLSFHFDPNRINKIQIFIKPGYSSWAWGVFSISSMMYYYVRSKGNTIVGGYTHPVFAGLIKILQMLPLVGLVLSWFGFVSAENSMIKIASGYLDSILILFIGANLGVGITGIKRFLGNRGV